MATTSSLISSTIVPSLVSPPLLLLLLQGGGQVAPKNDYRTLYAQWFHLAPQPVRFFVSGNIGNLVFYTFDKIVLHYLERVRPRGGEFNDSISFFTAYVLHIVIQHYVHALLVYGLDTIDTRDKYWATLRGMYRALISSAIGSTVLNAILLHYGLPKDVAFITTLVIFSVINYVWISTMVAKQKVDGANTKLLNQDRMPRKLPFQLKKNK